jgi:hypothetical protein
VRSQKKYFYWDISLEIRMFTLYISNIFVPVPSGPPQNINCQSRSPNSILLEWSKPKREERNGIIRGYWLQYYPRTLWYGKSTVMTTHSDNRTVSPYYGCHHVRGFSDPTRYVSELATYVPSHCHLLCVHVLSIYVASEMTNSNLFQKIQKFPKNPKFSKKSKIFQKIQKLPIKPKFAKKAKKKIYPKVLAKNRRYPRACRFKKYQIENRLWQLPLPTFF